MVPFQFQHCVTASSSERSLMVSNGSVVFAIVGSMHRKVSRLMYFRAEVRGGMYALRNLVVQGALCMPDSILARGSVANTEPPEQHVRVMYVLRNSSCQRVLYAWRNLSKEDLYPLRNCLRGAAAL